MFCEYIKIKLKTCFEYNFSSYIQAVKKACESLSKRLNPIREELGSDATWLDVVRAAHSRSTDLTSKDRYTAQELVPYTIWGITCAEVEVDILTGNLLIKRVDILEDTGESLSPGIDIGQVGENFKIIILACILINYHIIIVNRLKVPSLWA